MVPAQSTYLICFAAVPHLGPSPGGKITQSSRDLAEHCAALGSRSAAWYAFGFARRSWLTLDLLDHMSIRRKVGEVHLQDECKLTLLQTIEVMTLLYEAAKKAHKDDLQINSSALNPTTGVKRRHPDMLKKIVWRPDPNQPSHGVFVATDLDPNSELLSDLAPNTLITGTQDPSPKDYQQPANGNTQTQTV
jgi:hypothetical protein